MLLIAERNLLPLTMMQDVRIPKIKDSKVRLVFNANRMTAIVGNNVSNP